MLLSQDPRSGDPLLPVGDPPLDGWRLQLRRREGQGGRPQVVRDDDGAPLVLPPDATEDDCEPYRRDGWAHVVALGVRGTRTVITRPVPLRGDEKPDDDEEGEPESSVEVATAELLRAHAEAVTALSTAAVSQLRTLGELLLGCFAAGAELAGGAGAKEEGNTVEGRVVNLAETLVRIKGAETAAQLVAKQQQQQSPQLAAVPPPPPATPPAKNGAPSPKKGK